MLGEGGGAAACCDTHNLLLLQKRSAVCGLAANNCTIHRLLSTLYNFIRGFRENLYNVRLDYDTV